MTIKKLSLIFLSIFIIIFSFTKLSSITTDPQTAINKGNIASFDDKIETVLALSAGAAGTSAAISLLPGDAGTPIADQLSDFAKYFLLILSALYFEKYFVVISGFILSYGIIPIICILFIAYLIFNNNSFKNIAIKMCLVGCVIYCLIPTTVRITNLISETYESTIDEAKENELTTESADENIGLLDKFKNTASTAIDSATTYVSQLFEALAVMIVVTCLIPIAMLLIALWLIKVIFTQNPNVSYPQLENIKALITSKENSQ